MGADFEGLVIGKVEWKRVGRTTKNDWLKYLRLPCYNAGKLTLQARLQRGLSRSNNPIPSTLSGMFDLSMRVNNWCRCEISLYLALDPLLRILPLPRLCLIDPQHYLRPDGRCHSIFATYVNSFINAHFLLDELRRY